MRVIGITGGAGCGKSAVLKLLSERRRVYVISADDVAKELMQKGREAYLRTAEAFGEDILLKDGELNRQKLAEIIFRNEEKRIILNGIVHPAVKKYIADEAERLRREQNYDYVFVEAALLIEDHYETICDEFWYIYADTKVRRKRLKESRGYTDERIDGMFASQLCEEDFKKACRYRIDNSRELEGTIAQIEKILEE